ncbi:unnamed protein product [Albugo candida]|uniref:Uncharacterized protein n=1 Tax=Albugo candida TaxID=65357 RepID=A0A024FT00_9STRA|nr:unnamed protein product [Albugo candida]|eukprot:CCI10200.1 unnamed protein product [Albugo candida]
MTPGSYPLFPFLHGIHLNSSIVHKRKDHSNRVATTTNTRYDSMLGTSNFIEKLQMISVNNICFILRQRINLSLHYTSNDRLNISQNSWEWIRFDSRSNDVMCCLDVSYFTRSQIASLIASLSVSDPDGIGTTLAPSILKRNTSWDCLYAFTVTLCVAEKKLKRTDRSATVCHKDRLM